jgi:hypothetical protein
MKVVSELIQYFRHDLSREDLEYLKEQGFYRGSIPRGGKPKAKPAADLPAQPEDPAWGLEDHAVSVLNEELERAKKGKGKRAKKGTKISLEAFDQLLIETHIPQWEQSLASLFQCLPGVKNAAQARAALLQPTAWDEPKLQGKIRGLLEKHEMVDPLAKAALEIDYLGGFFEASKKLAPKDRDNLRAWVFDGQEPAGFQPTASCWWVKQVFRLQHLAISGMKYFAENETGKSHAVYFESNLSGDSGIFPLLLLLHYAETRQSSPGRPALHLLCPDQSLEKAVDVLLMHAPRQGAAALQSLHAAGTRKGTNTLNNNIRLLLSKIDLPDWTARLHPNNPYWVEGAMFTRETLAPFLADSFHIALHSNLQHILLKGGYIMRELPWKILAAPAEGYLPTEMGIYHLETQTMVPLNIHRMHPFSEGLSVTVPSKLSSTVCFMQPDGKVAFTRQYFEMAGDFSHGLAPVKANRQTNWGYIDRTGNLAIPALYKNAEPFSEGLAAVHTGGLWGYIDPNGRMILPPRFRFARPFSEGLAAVEENGRWFFIDKNGNTAIGLDKTVIDASHFSEGLAPVKTGNLWGYIDMTGAFAIPPRFASASAFTDGLAVVADPQQSWLRYHLINMTGTVVFSPGADFFWLSPGYSPIVSWKDAHYRVEWMAPLENDPYSIGKPSDGKYSLHFGEIFEIQPFTWLSEIDSSTLVFTAGDYLIVSGKTCNLYDQKKIQNA